ncbi:uncharacterized protein LOC110454713 isoform X2 [Mizuhopecten yessoensis]|uniref:uncharacterized protein LOC110454713 isoform X2 n=1 Tax=Mizuhopecten yessoensis TaxID=6573 RepID=UPI000B45DC31|nr:uncharacterized protein LOC110454713 isoform X2 [Mizuhopecten yessoensis]
MEFLKPEEHGISDGSSLSSESEQQLGVYNSEKEDSIPRWSPAEVYEDVQLEINAINEHQQNNGDGNTSISSDEGIHSLKSNNSETDPKIIQTKSPAGSSDPPNVSNHEIEHALSSSLTNSNPTVYHRENQLDSSDSPSVEEDDQETIVKPTLTIRKGAYPMFAYRNPVFQLEENQPENSQSDSPDSSSLYITGGEAIPPKNMQPTDTKETTLRGKKNLSRRSKKPLFCLMVVAGFLVAIVISVTVSIATSGAAEQPRDCTVTPEGETRCPISGKHVEAVLLNASKYVSEGDGEIVIPLNETTDTTVNDIHFYVKDGDLYYSNPNTSVCYKVGIFPVVLRNASEKILQRLPPINIEKQGLDDPVNIEPVVYRNLTDGRDYVLLICAVAHCDAVVTTAKLMVPGYSNIQKPMSCTHEGTTDGLNTCTITMTQDSFENAQYIQCASMSSTTESSVTINSADAKYKEPVSPDAVISHGQNATIVRHVTIDEHDVLVLEKEHSKLEFPTSDSTDSRITFSVSKTGSGKIVEVEIRLSPGTCFDGGKFVIRTEQGAFEIKTQVNDGPNLILLPTTSVSSVGARLVLKGIYCIADGAQTVTVIMSGKSENERLQTGSRVEIGNSSEYFIFDLKLNVLELVYVKKGTVCPDHNKTLAITVQNDNGVDLLDISTRMRVKANQYRISTTGGSFQENAEDKVIIFAASLGCRPTIQNVKLTINGKHDLSQADDIFGGYQVSNETGEMSIVKEYHLDVVTLRDNGTGLKLTISFTDDDGGLRFLTETVTVLVIPGEFCEGKTHGCNFKHPYRYDQYVACGDDVIAAIDSCPEHGQIFKASNCTGFCE